MATRAPAQDPQVEKLRLITNTAQLVQYLHAELAWPVEVDDVEDAFFDWVPAELHLSEDYSGVISSIKQLRPLADRQPWGIFFVEFDRKRLPIVALRRLLNSLAIKRRASAKKGGGYQTWHARDLLFVSSFGEAGHREIALAHFTDESEHGDLPVLRVLGWHEDNQALQLAAVADTLRRKLRWPALTEGAAAQKTWREQWASAFTLQYRQAINDAKSLALALAVLAKRIRVRANDVLEAESERGHLRKLHQAFKANLIADLTPDGFADMFAQTIAYGLFTAQVSRGSGALVADNVVDMVPSTNPFLRDLLNDFLTAAGRARQRDKRVDFDELGINDVVETLRHAPMDDILRSFNSDRPGEDPVIHFYEDFLKAYDKKMRAQRGVFYTPRPVVQFIVRSVHEILQTEFGIEDGLASTITWGEMRKRRPELALPAHTTDDMPFVQMLDPATGTGTFLVEIIELIYAHMRAQWAKRGWVTREQIKAPWNDYVRHHLLPRLHGFELMMAPYAIAHMKIGLKLAETGYTFPADGPRVNVFLTNALEPAHEIQPQLETIAPMLAHEAHAANCVKERLAATVIVGNPPYSVSSQNKGDWITRLCDVYKRDLASERNIQPLSDDYIKFLRLSTWHISRAGIGALGMITNREFLKGVLHRSLRRTLLDDFTGVLVTDLHGQRGELFANPVGDENVFEIEKGVSITHLISGMPSFRREHRELVGPATAKLSILGSHTLSSMPFVALDPSAPSYSISGRQSVELPEYERMTLLTDLFSRVPVTGFATHRDAFAIDFDRTALRERLQRFLSPQISDETLVSKYGLSDTRDWKLGPARTRARRNGAEKSIRQCLYRPFDLRWVIYSDDILEYSRRSTMDHIGPGRLALIASRIVKDEVFAHSFISQQPVEKIFLSPKSSNNAQVLLAECLRVSEHLSFDGIDSTLKPSGERWIGYVYAVLHSPVYRARYATGLSNAFPRIPIPGSRSVFDAMAALGEQLVQWHLLEHSSAMSITATSAPAGVTVPTFTGADRKLLKVAEKSRELAAIEMSAEGPCGTVFINLTSGFTGVRQAVWQHAIGGYQVLHKWLDDRRKAQRSLSDDDIAHWRRVYAALEATQGLMRQIDEAIVAHGGWPMGTGSGGAFSLKHSPPDPVALAADAAARPKGKRKPVSADQAGLGFDGGHDGA